MAILFLAIFIGTLVFTSLNTQAIKKLIKEEPVKLIEYLLGINVITLFFLNVLSFAMFVYFLFFVTKL